MCRLIMDRLPSLSLGDATLFLPPNADPIDTNLFVTHTSSLASEGNTRRSVYNDDIVRRTRAVNNNVSLTLAIDDTAVELVDSDSDDETFFFTRNPFRSLV